MYLTSVTVDLDRNAESLEHSLPEFVGRAGQCLAEMGELLEHAACFGDIYLLVAPCLDELVERFLLLALLELELFNALSHEFRLDPSLDRAHLQRDGTSDLLNAFLESLSS